jgi:Zn finger protein HypA/HybF involved in hydrogenase expression
VHELSVAVEICRMTEERLGSGDCPRLVAVGVVVGDDSGLEADNLQFCLEALLEQEPFGRARPVIQRVPGTDLSISFFEVEDGSQDDRSP